MGDRSMFEIGFFLFCADPLITSNTFGENQVSLQVQFEIIVECNKLNLHQIYVVVIDNSLAEL